jgi:signal transduction histidine kinase
MNFGDFALQGALAQIAIALSVFSLITYLWLGLTVLLIGNRSSTITWVGGLGLLMAALFFLCHGALVGAGVPPGGSPTDFWWRLSWVPAFSAPILWAATGLHYAGLTGTMRRLRLPALIAVAALGTLSALLVVMNWQAIQHYGDFIRLLGASLRLHGAEPTPVVISPALPALGLAFVLYVTTCACLPWASLAARRLRPSSVSAATPPRASGGTGNTGATDAALLWDPADAWGRARPALLLASLCMMGAGLVVALIGIASSFSEHAMLGNSAPDVLPVDLPATPPGHVPLILVTADLVVQVALAGLVLLLGWAVVRQGVLVERRLPQRGFLSHWRGTVFVALVLGCVVSGMASFEPEALPDFLLLMVLATTMYALFTWQSYGEHDRLLSQLRPFIASLAIGQTSWLTPEPEEVERSVEALFTSLCRDVLGASRGRLSLTAGRLRRSFTYVSPDAQLPDATSGREWVLPVMDERGVVARLVLGPRSDGAGYTSADLEVARACGQRILDAVGEFAATQAIVSLARRRGLEAELSAALPRRVLHDDVLPRLHLAMLRLEALRGRVHTTHTAPSTATQATPIAAGTAGSRAPIRAAGDRGDAAEPTEVTEGDSSISGELSAVVRELGRAHHDLAALMRAAPAANPRRLEHGLVAVLRSSLDGEFRGTFDEVEWQAPPDACNAADKLPPIVADLLLGAALEAIRNAGRHARGEDLHRHLKLRVELETDAQWVVVRVADDGVGIQSEAERNGRAAQAASLPTDSLPSLPVVGNGGTRTGLLAHGALVALVGGSLTVRSQPGPGTTVTVRVPRSDATAAYPQSEQ